MMIGTGTIVNAAGIVAGASLGVLAGKRLSERFKEIALQAMGLSIIMVGASGALQGILAVGPAGLERKDLLLVIFSLTLGGLAGEAVGIEAWLERWGRWIQSNFARGGDGRFVEGFVSASLIFCVGAMAIVGSLEDGLAGNPSTLLAKAVLDCVLSVVFASTMGFGVAFSALPVFLYQGAITLLAGSVRPWLVPAVIGQVSAVGSVLILAIGINILFPGRVRVGNLLPAVLVPVLWHLLRPLVVP